MSTEIGKYIGFCVYRKSYLLWSPVRIVREIPACLLGRPFRVGDRDSGRGTY